MDKYLVVVLACLAGGMVVGVSQDPPQWILFHAGIAGIIIVVMYSAFRNRREQQELRRRRRRGEGA